ncbi:ABC transporter substrate-binding protein [Legionella oakridgensis]|uniref:Putrescine-binding periplasmic protein n=2 Tax=Legionella oakridgensis TaxID=29423 RepID=W0BDV3_9GAMM|nr:spermidine/putrescine ABC transporter substrate-binding protein [Legionella oakridgensis]AHE66782.1 spermidine/putrescine-binding periplasmic protein [Legionella oakridgensis ATCC 33761 = DSM 21215]KTD39818.1 spermidine/putrescine-binding periplasmic protein precursor potD (SPBP) [Legionella oakridgensis]STY19902.1 spermidine/putrescine-binding periplasmic protein precursor potD (SPBP) [Legionella longbeachae]
MKQSIRTFFLLLIVLFTAPTYANNVVNVYVWGGEIPKSLIHQFERETGIKVNFSTYDSNETMYAKLKASRQSVYDVIMPSGYYVERMKKQGMLTKLTHDKIPNLDNIDPLFTKSQYDAGNHYSVPLTWGATGIFYNTQWVHDIPKKWSDLWEKRWHRQLLLLDDSREVFSIALMSLGYHPNDKNPAHIQQAYEQLLALVPNIKLFASDSVQAIIIDEDAIAGSAWNGDAYKAQAENKQIHFIYPKEGYVIWVGCLSIPNHPPHPKEAYAFINFMLKPSSAVQIALREGHAITNAKGKALLPDTIRHNPMIYPSQETLKRGYFQQDVGDKTIALYNQYWEQLKLSF